MDDRKLQFRVGLFAILATVGIGAMIFEFGELKTAFEPCYSLSIHFGSAPGVYVSTPVRRNGIDIGSVRELSFDDELGGVNVIVDIRQNVTLRRDSHARLVRSLMGDASIEFSPGASRELLEPGDRLKGDGVTDPMMAMNRIEDKLNITLDSLRSTSRQWEHVAKNLNSLLETNHGPLNTVINRAASALNEFTITMQDTHKIVGDPQTQENLRKALAALPTLVSETQQTIAAVQSAVHNADKSLASLADVTVPLAKRSTTIIDTLDRTLANIESLSGELNDFVGLMVKKDGTIRRFAADPELYDHLNRSAAALAVLLKNIDPIVRDMRVFSDKVARHPELIGVSGALLGSSGIKETDGNQEDQAPRESRLRPGGNPQRR